MLRLECITEYNEAEAMELLRKESEARGEARGITIGKVKNLVSLANDGLIPEEIAAREARMYSESMKCSTLHISALSASEGKKNT